MTSIPYSSKWVTRICPINLSHVTYAERYRRRKPSKMQSAKNNRPTIFHRLISFPVRELLQLQNA